MTIKDFYQLKFLRRELNRWQNRLDEQTEIKSPLLTGMPHNTDISDNVADLAITKFEIRAGIEALMINIEFKIAEIEKFILTLDDPLLRMIIEIKFCTKINGEYVEMSWKEVAAQIGCGVTEDSIKKMFYRKIQKC